MNFIKVALKVVGVGLVGLVAAGVGYKLGDKVVDGTTKIIDKVKKKTKKQQE